MRKVPAVVTENGRASAIDSYLRLWGRGNARWKIKSSREDAQTRRIAEERTTFSAALSLPPFNLVGSLFFRHQIIGESLDGCFRPSLLRAGLNTGTLKVQPGNSASSARYKIVAPPDGCVAGSHLYHCFILSPRRESMVRVKSHVKLDPPMSSY